MKEYLISEGKAYIIRGDEAYRARIASNGDVLIDENDKIKNKGTRFSLYEIERKIGRETEAEEISEEVVQAVTEAIVEEASEQEKPVENIIEEIIEESAENKKKNR